TPPKSPSTGSNPVWCNRDDYPAAIHTDSATSDRTPSPSEPRRPETDSAPADDPTPGCTSGSTCPAYRTPACNDRRPPPVPATFSRTLERWCDTVPPPPY